MKKTMSSWHVSVAAEAYAAALFAQCGYDVSVQYGANQPEYDIIIVKANQMLKISVKGSQDGSWGLTQKFKKSNCTYHEAVTKWLSTHHKGTIFCLVQFQDITINDMPRIYLATPDEIAGRLNASAAGRGETILYENHVWSKQAVGYGTIEKIPDTWRFSKERVHDLLSKFGL